MATTLLIYGLMAVVPGLLLLFMAVFGADTDVDVDTDFDVDADVDVDIEAGEFGGPGRLSLRLILFFVVGFGVGGYVSVYFKWPLHHILIGFIGGSIAWFLGYQLLKLLYKQQSTSQIKLISFVGKQGRVVVPIPKDGGTGEIEATNKETGQSTYFNARADDSKKEYKRGEFVKIKSVAGKTAVVE
jgi:membrane protein implicated in regulation of membrane protease activity